MDRLPEKILLACCSLTRDRNRKREIERERERECQRLASKYWVQVKHALKPNRVPEEETESRTDKEVVAFFRFAFSETQDPSSDGRIMCCRLAFFES